MEKNNKYHYRIVLLLLLMSKYINLRPRSDAKHSEMLCEEYVLRRREWYLNNHRHSYVPPGVNTCTYEYVKV